MRPDSLEHTAAFKNLEELSSLEVTSTLAKSSTVPINPINLWLKAVRASGKRSIEEQQLVAEEGRIHLVRRTFIEQYKLQVGCVHLFERLLLCEASMLLCDRFLKLSGNTVNTVREYHCVKFPEMLILDHYSLLCASIDDGHDSDYHFTDHEDVVIMKM